MNTSLRWLDEARRHLGEREIAGPVHNPTILSWWRAIRRGGIRGDETPWCAAFVGGCLEAVGIESSPLKALAVIDPEILVDSMTIAGAYIESRGRSFSQYAKAIIDDLGDAVKPYLLSFGRERGFTLGLEARTYLSAVADALRPYGFEPHEDRRGKAEKPVRVNESGPAVSGDVTLTVRNAENGFNIYIHIGDTALRGMVPVTPSGIAIMYRVGPGADRYAARAGNSWAPVDLSAKELAALIHSRIRPAEATEESRDAAVVPSGEIPRADQGSAADVAPAGDGDRQSVDDGVA